MVKQEPSLTFYGGVNEIGGARVLTTLINYIKSKQIFPIHREDAKLLKK